MRDETNEVGRLKRLLSTQRLSEAERKTLEQRVKELEPPPAEVVPKPMPGVLGVFDRPQPSATQPDAPEREAADAGNSLATESPEPSKSTQPLEPEMSPEEVDELADKITDIADRIVWLRSIWARTLSIEVDREGEAWLAQLQTLAKKLPEEVLEAVLGKDIDLLHKKVRDVRKPIISENLQRRILPPSAPSLDAVGTWSELYYDLRQPRAPRDPRPPRGYVPDGLQALVS